MDKDRITQAYASIEDLLNGEPETVRALQGLIEPLSRGLMTKITVKLSKTTTVRMGVTADGSLRIERSDIATHAEEI